MTPIGGPLHCGNPMTGIAGYQCGGRSAWNNFRCGYCRKTEVHWGTISGAVGHERWTPRKNLTLIVLMKKGRGGVICKGIANDETCFENILYVDANTAVQMIGKRYAEAQGYTVHYNLPEPEKENA